MRFLVVVVLFVSAVSAEEVVRFPPAPRLAITADELAALRISLEIGELTKSATRVADEWLQRPGELPSEWGNWIFYYACPDDGASLNALSQSEHQCPQCKKIVTDERTVAAYRTAQHNRADQATLQLGWAYTFTGDEKYAREAQRILLHYADVYAKFPTRRDRWGRSGWLATIGGRRYCQSLDEAVGVIAMAKGYDLSRNAACWTNEQQRHVEKDFFRATAETLLWWNAGVNNHQTWYNAGLLAIASVLEDTELVNRVLTMRGGFRDQLARSIGRDGLWYEGTMAYHNYALQAMTEIVTTGRRLGLPLHNEPRFRAMIEAPLQCCYPNGMFPAINDSDPFHLSGFNGSFLWAWQTYREPRFAQAYAVGDEKKLHELLGPTARPIPVASTDSLDLPDAGLAILRRGSGAQAICVMLDYGQHGGGHGHFDKLNVMLFANGREWLLDPGRLSYSHKEYKTWVKQTAAHNTVTVGGTSQFPATGRLLWFQAEPNFSACAATCDNAYPGTTLTRYLLLNDSFLLDLFDVELAASREPAQLDWLAHAVSHSLLPATADEAAQPQPQPQTETIAPGSRDGYEHLVEAQHFPPRPRDRWDFVTDDLQRLRVWQINEPAAEIFRCTGIGYTTTQKVPCLIRRVTGRTARFVTVYDLSGRSDQVVDVQQTPNTRTIQITTPQKKHRVTFSAEGAQFE